MKDLPAFILIKNKNSVFLHHVVKQYKLNIKDIISR